MLLFPENIEEGLEVDIVRQLIAGFCITEAGSERVYSAKPVEQGKRLQAILDQTNEFIQILTSGVERPSLHFEDIQHLLVKIKVAGTFLEGEDLQVLNIGLKTLLEWKKFFQELQEDYPVLSKTFQFGDIDHNLVVHIEKIIDDRGEIRDSASPELGDIRKSIQSAERKVRTSIHRILEKSKKDNYTEDDAGVTIRDGRLVIPVKSEFKRRLSGFVHDESSTGQTVFMEPAEVLELNNEVRELRYRERREIQNILLKVADHIREHLFELERGSKSLIILDFIHAKARFAQEFNASIPQFKTGSSIHLRNARHPILWLNHKNQGRKVVPLDLELDHKERFLVISGPNAGGKSVALKTIGLLQYLFQCGFPVTADPDSELGSFNNIFIDIGDSQSLENDLSTYSSHLRAMKYFCEFADKRTLVLIDEFGTGTEPQFGGAIAEAILEQLGRLGTYGVVTTHYSNLKEFATKQQGMLNGAMKYDSANLEPLFELEIGKPGSSFAFEIAGKIGLKKSIIDAARKKAGYQQVKYDELLSQLEAERNRLSTQNNQLERESSEIRQIRDDYETLKRSLESEKKSILKQAKQEAEGILREGNRKVEQVIREIREKQAEKEATKRIRKALHTPSANEKKETKKKEDLPQIAVGDQVIIEGQDTVGQVVAVKAKQAEVNFGLLKSFVELSRLKKISKRESKKLSKPRSAGMDLGKKLAGFAKELDVRGKRAEEVLPIVDKFLDDAMMLGMNEVKILHGKGYGVLREMIRSHLKEDPNVISASDEHVERGGSGITLVTLK